MRQLSIAILAVVLLAGTACGKKEAATSGKGGSDEPWMNEGRAPEKAAEPAPTKAAEPAPTKVAEAPKPVEPTPPPPPPEPAAPEPQAQVCAGNAHTCVLKADGKVLCFGQNLDGQLGDGTAVSRDSAVPVVGLADAKSVSCGAFHACVTRAGGGISCWGRSFHGELGNGRTDATQVPVDVTGITDATAVSAGSAFTCALHASGTVSCWGSGKDGRLGTGKEDDSNVPVEVAGITDAKAIAAGQSHACALRQGGEVLCWGANNLGQLGRGSDDRTASPTPAPVAGLSGAQALDVGSTHACALLEGGKAKCWGGGSNGQLGNGKTSDEANTAEPVEVLELTGAAQLALGSTRSCARLESGEVQCWGYNNYTANMVGSGSPDGDVPKPEQVKDLAGATDVALGYAHSCALAGAKVVCWGSNEFGQLGIGEKSREDGVNTALEDLAAAAPAAFEPFTFPATLEGEPPAVVPHIAFGDKFICGVTAEHTVLCFGDGGMGQLGNGSTGGVPSERATTVPGITDALQVSAAMYRTCVVRANGRVACWGNLLKTNTSLPMPVEGLEDATQVAVGGNAYGIYACALRAGGKVSCWGLNSDGELGDGTTTASAAAVEVQGLEGAKAVAVAMSTACAITSADKLVCWGDNSNGETGTGSEETSLPAPTEVRGLSKVTLVAGAGYNFCAVHSRGKLSCWGKNDRGQIGNTKVDAESPVTRPSEVRGLRNVESVGLGGGTVCAVVRGGAASCWGANAFGQTGHDESDPEQVTRPWAVLTDKDETVAGFGGFLAFACTYNTCCGLHLDGHVSCSGTTPIGGAGDFIGFNEIRSVHPVPATGVQYPGAPVPAE